MTEAASHAITSALEVVALVSLGVAVLVGRAAPKRENRVFAVFAGAVAAWVLSNALFRLSADGSAAATWARAADASAAAIGAAFLHLSWVFPVARARSRLYHSERRLWLAAGLITAAMLTPGFAVAGVDLDRGAVVRNLGVAVLALFLGSSAVAGFSTFLRSRRGLHGRAREQVNYVLLGLALTAAFGLTANMVLPLGGDYRWVWVGPLSAVFLVASTGYAIIALRLFDVRVIIGRTFVYTALVTFVGAAFKPLEAAAEKFLVPILGDGSVSPYVAALVVALLADPLKRWLEGAVRRYLMKRRP